MGDGGRSSCVPREGLRQTALYSAQLLAGKAEQCAAEIERRAVLVQDARKFNGNLLQAAQTVNGLDEVIDALLAGIHCMLAQ